MSDFTYNTEDCEANVDLFITGAWRYYCVLFAFGIFENDPDIEWNNMCNRQKEYDAYGKLK